jgi:general secretion pathway protein I
MPTVSAISRSNEVISKMRIKHLLTGLNHRRCQRYSTGFTLLEVLVALVIVGTALGACLRAVGSLTRNSDGLRASMMATWSAENKLTQIRLASEFPDVGESDFDCPQGDLLLVCHEQVLATPNPMFRRVEVSVADSQYPDRRIIKLNQLVPR